MACVWAAFGGFILACALVAIYEIVKYGFSPELPTTDDESVSEHRRWCLCTCDYCDGVVVAHNDGRDDG